MKKHYSSKRSSFTIHRPPSYRNILFRGDIVAEKVEYQPVEFKNNRFDTADAEVIAYMEAHPSFNVDFFLVENVGASLETAGVPDEEVPAPVMEYEPDPDDPVQIIEGVTNKNGAIAALVERGVDPDLFDRTTKKDAVKSIAASHGFEFAGW